MKDFSRFIMVVCAVLTGLLLGWFGLYKVSQQPHHPSRPTPLVARLLENSPFVIETAPSSRPNFRFAVANYRQNQWWVGDQGLRDVLEEHKGKFLFLEPQTLESAPLAQLKVVMEEQDFWKNTVFLSRSDAILKDLRELAPQWSFGTGEVFLARFLSLSGLKLWGLLEVPGDVLYVTNHRKLHADEAKNIIQAAAQQNKLVIFGALNKEFAGQKQTAHIADAPSHSDNND